VEFAERRCRPCGVPVGLGFAGSFYLVGMESREGANVSAICSKRKSNSVFVVYEPAPMPCVRGSVAKVLNIIGCVAGLAACIMAVVVGMAL